ncbi:MAG: cell wall hydrolase [Clostridiaceae bacterium]
MIRKTRAHSLKNILHGPFGARGKIGRALRRNTRLPLYALAGCVFAVILLICLLGRPSSPISGSDIVQIGDNGQQTSPSVSPGGDAFEGEAQATPGQPTAPPAGTATPLPDQPTASPVGTATPPPDQGATPGPALSPTPSLTPVDFDALIEFYRLKADRYYGDYGYSSNHYTYTDEELNMLAKLICGEARGESLKGKLAVANVVMNRVLARGYPGDTIKAVITAPGQFSGYSASIRPSSACVYAAKQVLEKEVWVIPQNVFFFQSNKPAGENWGGHTFCVKIGGHCFYTESYSGRSRNSTIPPALYERVYQWPQFGCEPGKRVHRVQYMLSKLGYDVEADGYFGKTTKEALIAFQKEHRLKTDGVAGPSTLKALIRAYGESAYCARFA